MPDMLDPDITDTIMLIYACNMLSPIYMHYAN